MIIAVCKCGSGVWGKFAGKELGRAWESLGVVCKRGRFGEGLAWRKKLEVTL
jgi:hypothetical protein